MQSTEKFHKTVNLGVGGWRRGQVLRDFFKNSLLKRESYQGTGHTSFKDI